MKGISNPYTTVGNTALTVEAHRQPRAKIIPFSKECGSQNHDHLDQGQPSATDIALAFLPNILIGLLFLI